MPSTSDSFMVDPSQISIHDSDNPVYMSLPIFSKLVLCEESTKNMLTSAVPLRYSGITKSLGRFIFALLRNKEDLSFSRRHEKLVSLTYVFC